jgi:hypothetical protein
MTGMNPNCPACSQAGWFWCTFQALPVPIQSLFYSSSLAAHVPYVVSYDRILTYNKKFRDLLASRGDTTAPGQVTINVGISQVRMTRMLVLSGENVKIRARTIKVPQYKWYHQVPRCA